MTDYNRASATASYGITSAYESLFGVDASQSHARRLSAYQKFWLFYLGKHWTYERDPGEPTLTINYCRRILDLHTDFAFKKGFKNVVPDDPATKTNEKDEREFVRRMLEETWDKNCKLLWAMEAGQQGGVTGDMFARVSWDKTDPLEDPYARVDIIPSHLMFPELGGPSGTDRKQVKKMLIVTPTYVATTTTSTVGRFFTSTPKLRRHSELVIKSEVWTAPVIDRDGNTTEEAMQYEYTGGELVNSTVNPLGTIPVVHIPNYPLSGEYYGISDLVDAVELNRELNEKATDISDIINYHGSPQTIITGARIKDLEKGSNRVWSLPADAKVSNLELAGDLAAATNHWKMLKGSLLELTNTPEAAIASQDTAGSATGVALQMQYLPMMEKRDLKVLTFGQGIRKINRLILMTAEIGDKTFGDQMAKLKGNPYRNQVVFPDPMPQDERRILEISREKIDQGLISRRKELEDRGHSQAEITKILEEIKQEQMDETEAVFDTSPKRGKNTFERGGPNGTRGEKIGQTQIAEQ